MERTGIFSPFVLCHFCLPTDYCVRFSSNTIKKSRASMMKVDCFGTNLRFEVFSSPDGPDKRTFEIILFDQSKLDAKKEVGLQFRLSHSSGSPPSFTRVFATW
jgi:hypothetical protein